jgi:hypothetical protein
MGQESGESAAVFAGRGSALPPTRSTGGRASLVGAVSRVPASTLSRIVELRAEPMPGDTRFEIDVGGRRVRVPAVFDEAGLRRLLRTLEATP